MYEKACQLSDDESSEVAHFFGKGFIRGFMVGAKYALDFLRGKEDDKV